MAKSRALYLKLFQIFGVVPVWSVRDFRFTINKFFSIIYEVYN